MPIDSNRIQAVFLLAVEATDASARARVLNGECGADVELRQRVEALLAAHDASGGFLDRPPVSPLSTVDEPRLSERPGGRIGPYKLLQQLGEGGMGVVFLAEQLEPVQRKVALKVIKPGMDTRQVVARFEAERQALALMDHPNIARVLDAGATDSGRPYFVMELVKGMPITRYCDEEHLTPQERLQLFVPVCQAVQHAHQKGIIHRDLKPSNILIALYDGKPVPKVIDFGVAKATGAKLTDHTLFTEVGHAIGTWEYMAPEQAEVNNLDIDTRADIYALGATLYELLAGSPPFTGQQLRKAAFDEMLRMIREVEPPRPSTRLSSSDELPSLAAKRKLEPAKLSRLVRGDLDWIVMKCLEKERGRRYETANGVAADVLRFLGGEAVQAHPPSTVYRLKKFVKRYKGQVIAASLVFLALVAGMVGTTLGFLEAKKQEAEAKKNLEHANKNLAFAKKGNEILGSVFMGLDPEKGYATVGELSQALKDNLKKAVQELEGSAIGEPLEVAHMQTRLGVSLFDLGEFSLALELDQKALATYKAKLGPDYPATLNVMNNLASAYWATGHPAKAVALQEETVARTKARLGPNHFDTLNSMSNLVMFYLDSGQQAKAVTLGEQTVEKLKASFPDHPRTLTSMNNLATAYRASGQVAKAVPLFQETLEKIKAKLGPHHPHTLTGMHNLALAYRQLKCLDRSIPLFEEALKGQKKQLGEQHVDTVRTLIELIAAYKEAGRLPLLEEQFVGLRRQLPKDSPQLADKLDTFGLVLLQVEAFSEAEPLLRECLAIREKQIPDSWLRFSAQSLLGGALLGQKKYADAEPLLLKGYEGMKAREKTIPKRDAELHFRQALDRLIELYTVLNKRDEVRKWRAERAKYPPGRSKSPEKK